MGLYIPKYWGRCNYNCRNCDFIGLVSGYMNVFIVLGLGYAVTGAWFVLFAIIDNSKLKKKQCEYTEKDYAREKIFIYAEYIGGSCGLISSICSFLIYCT